MTQCPGAADVGEAKAASSATGSPSAILEALFLYFVVALAMAALLEPIGAFFMGAGADPLMAVLSQATATLLVLLWTAGWVVEGFNVPPNIGTRLAVGAGAMALLLASGFALVFLILGIWPWELARRLANPEGVVVAFSVALGALLPVIRVRGPGA